MTFRSHLERPNRRYSARGAASPEQMDTLIERVALSPGTDAGKLDRLLAYNQRIYSDRARTAFDIAFSSLQLALPTLPEQGEIRDREGVRRQHLWRRFEVVI